MNDGPPLALEKKRLFKQSKKASENVLEIGF